MFDKIDKFSLRMRWVILVVTTAVCMSAIVYFWYRSLTTSLLGSFEVENHVSNTKEQDSEGGLGFLASLFKDSSVDFDWSRFNDMKDLLSNFGK